ncbi:hypothetical protein H0H10_32725 [Streptomyces sp. TRM S81-3]|uniref:DUF7848 domain-containing protein n=1 Tax=Streptomyces griseicoloratus TaxID=2752516 RepID=A0A926L967_9ACTN|nr:hypothetical protein [Streptomyces griseicoloratus]MBD0423871.1 hypothetical protein [Streptomyces griseicoloratus]
MEPGSLVYDPRTRRVGEYQGLSGPYVMLRPVGGGREWQADPALVRAATSEERISAGVRAVNGRSLVGLLTDRPLVEVGPPPEPFAGCATCTALARRRARARAEGDGSAETDADVLLARHQRLRHGVDRAGRRIFRYVPFTIVQDPSALPEYEARCVSGDESDCGAASGPFPSPEQVEEWQRRHTQETRHTRYRRCFTDYAVLECRS